MKIVLLGPPNAGKGTQANKLTEHFNIKHISTGNILRQAVSEDTPVGKTAKPYMEAGLLVPDDVVTNIVNDELSRIDLDQGFLFDGYPRTIAQAEDLDQTLKSFGTGLDHVVLIRIDYDLLVDRAVGRRVCENCGATYHVKFNPPKVEEICDKCGSHLTQREDDNEQTVRDRIEVYLNQTRPLVKYYEERGLLRIADGKASPDEVFESILATMGDEA